MNRFLTRATTHIALACVVTLNAGCVTTLGGPKSLSAEQRTALQGQTLAVGAPAIRHDFLIFRPDNIDILMGGEAAMAKEGNQLARANNLPDPALGTGRALAQALMASNGMKPGRSFALDENDPVSLSRAAAPDGVALYLQTLDWRTWFYPLNIQRYRAHVEVSARLVDTRSQTLLAKATCEASSPQEASQAPTLEEAVAWGAARLLAEQARAEAACAASLHAQLTAR